MANPITGYGSRFRSLLPPLANEYCPIVGSNSGSLVCFSSDTWKWVDISGNYMIGMHFWRAEGAFEVNGRVEKKDERAVWRFIPPPKGCRMPNNTLKLEEKWSIFGSGGYIHYMELFEKGDCLLKLWSGLMKPGPKSCFAHPFDVDIILFGMQDDVFSFNFRTHKVESCANFTGHKLVFSFVLPSWPTSLAPHLYATYAKEKGNDYFKEQNFAEAIESYSRSIAQSPNAFAYANRAWHILSLVDFVRLRMIVLEL
ncbi:Hsp70-Hsp90 organizing protein 1 [Bienertia sinuspersici]